MDPVLQTYISTGRGGGGGVTEEEVRGSGGGGWVGGGRTCWGTEQGVRRYT